MTGNDVIEVVVWLNAADITLWIDGGWGIDALVGEQTRPHDDLDIVINLERNTDAIATLSCHDFLLHHDGRPVSFIMRDEHDRQVDFHPVRFDAEVPVGRLYRTAASSATHPKVSPAPERSPPNRSAASPPNSRHLRPRLRPERQRLPRHAPAS